MAKSKQPQGGVAALNALISGGTAAAEAEVPAEEPTPEEIEAKVKTIMDVVKVEGGMDMFFMQGLIEECAEQLRGDIHDAFFAPEDDGKDGK